MSLMHKRSITLIFLAFFVTSILSAGNMIVPRKVHMLSTKYFDILFSEESGTTARLIADNGDTFFENASEKYGLQSSFRIPVVISPDSDCFSISYSPIPYNRIIIYEAAPDENDAVNSDIMLANFYKEVVHAVSQSIKNKKALFLSKLIPVDAFQPVFLTNMPFAFLEGLQLTEEASYFQGQGKLNDRFFLQILSQAKLEGHFPTYMQVSGAMDIYPGDIIPKAAGSAFCAYLIQSYGFEKFYEFWQEGADFHLYLNRGIFKKIYELDIDKAWSDFEETIPLPQELEKLQYIEEFSEELLPNENRGLYTNILSSPYGMIWYDDIRHEVSIYNPNSFIQGRQLLFLADDVTRLSLSPDGRFIAVSFIKNGLRDNLKKNCVWIFDVKKRIFTGDSFALKDACFIQFDDDTMAIAGTANKTNHSALQIYSCSHLNNLLSYEQTGKTAKTKKQLLFEKDFSTNTNLYTTVSPSQNIVYGILNYESKNRLYRLDIQSGQSNQFEIHEADGTSIDAIKNLNLADNPYNSTFQDKLLVFQFIGKNDVLSKFGFFFLNKESELKQLWLLDDSVSGGINYPAIKENYLFYTSIKYNHGEIRKLAFNKLNFKHSTFSDVSEQTASLTEFSDNAPFIGKKGDDKKHYYLDDYKLKTYHPIKYMYNGMIIPMMPVFDLSMREGAEYWPGLGLSFLSETDPFSNNSLLMSIGFGFMPHSFEKLNNPTKMEIIEKREDDIMKIRDFSASALFQNTSTPVDISAGGIYKSTAHGDYMLKTMLGAKWILPLGMNFRKLTMQSESDFSISTKYREVYKADIYPSMPDYTPLNKAYQDYLFSILVEYSNLHQFGFSPYEKRGISAGLISTLIWDFNLPDGGKSKPIFNSRFFKTASQINLGFYANLAIPQLLPFKDYNNNILCLPTEIALELFKTNGTAFDVKTELLIFGKEIQNGIPLINFYFSRIGLKIGYDFSLIYDINTVALPDLRNFAYLYNAFSSTQIDDSIYIITDLGFTPAIGFLSSARFKTDFKLTFHLRSNAFKFAVNFEYEL